MEKDALRERGRVLEELFFKELDKELLANLREQLASQAQKKVLNDVTGVTDDAVLEALLQHGVDGEVVAAFSLLPLVAVAWADGKIDTQERQAILRAAEEDGVKPNESSYQLLSHWLDEEPPEQLIASWQQFAQALGRSLSPQESQSLKEVVLSRAQRVAEAAGGFLGLGSKVSQTESAVLNNLKDAFN